MSQFRVPVLEHFEYQQNVKDKDLFTPPVSPTKGDRYIVAATATGAWAGQEKKIAWYDGAAWKFDTPLEGWTVWVEDENFRYQFNGTIWETVADMRKAVYDTNNDGVVDHAELADLATNATSAEQVSDGVNTTTAAQVKDAYNRRGIFDAQLKAVLFEL